MLKSLFERLLFSMFFIGLLTYFIAMMFLEKNKKFIDEKNQMEKDILYTTETFLNEVTNKKEEMENNREYESYVKQKEGFQTSSVIEGLDIAGDIMKAFTKPFQPLIDFFNKLKDAFESLPRRVNNFGNAFKGFGKGIELEFVNIGKSVDLGFSDVFNVIGTIGKCGMKSLTNLRSCMIWYIMDCIGTTIYAIFIELPVFIIRLITGYNIQPYINKIYQGIELIDTIVFKYTCYHIIHYPDWVIEQCYTCKFQDKVDKLNLDWKKTIPDLMQAPNKIFKQAEDDFKSVFT